MVISAENCVREINKELEGTGVSVDFVKEEADKNSFLFGTAKATIRGAGRSGTESIEFRGNAVGYVNILKPRRPGIGESPDIYYEDAEDDTLAKVIRAYLTEAFSS